MSKETFRQRLRNAPAERERERREAEARAAREKAEELRRQEEEQQRKIAEDKALIEREIVHDLPMLKKTAREFSLREKAEVFAEELGISPDQLREFIGVEKYRDNYFTIFGYRVELARRTGREVGYKKGRRGKPYYLSPGPKEILTDTLELYTACAHPLDREIGENDITIWISSSQWKLLIPGLFRGIYEKESYKNCCHPYWQYHRPENLEDWFTENFEEIKNTTGRQWATREARKNHNRMLNEVDPFYIFVKYPFWEDNSLI